MTGSRQLLLVAQHRCERVFFGHLHARRYPPHRARARAASGVPAAAGGDDGSPREAASATQLRASIWRASEFLHPFHNPRANARFLSLAFGGMLCSVATLIHDSYLPTFMKEELGMTNTRIGSVQALAQLLAQVSKSSAGIIGDLLGSQIKVLMVGILLTTLAKPLFALSSLVLTHFGVAACLWCITIGKLADRVSRGLREAPTKALISRAAEGAGEPADAAFSVRQSIMSVGALLGSAVASIAFMVSKQSYVTTFAAATVPPVLAFAWLTLTFQDEEEPKAARAEKRGEGSIVAATSGGATPPRADGGAAEIGGARGEELGWLERGMRLVRAFAPGYWQALLVVAILYFARFDFAWVFLRAQACGVPRAVLPMLASTNMAAMIVTSFTVGKVAKGRGVAVRNACLGAGFLVLLAANALLASPLTASVAGMFGACTLIGIHMGMTHGLTLSMLSGYMPHKDVPGIGSVSGTAWSFTDLVLGCILAASNQLAGRLTDWTVAQSWGNVGCFYGGATASVAATAMLVLLVTFGDLGRDPRALRVAKA